MNITIGHQKGGVGKSTVAVNLATVIQKRRPSEAVVLLDTDRQATTSMWAETREENEELQYMPCVQKYGRIKKTIQELAQNYDHVIVDVAGRDSEEMRSAMLVTDFLLCPYRPSRNDFDTIPHLLETLDAASELNENMTPVAFLNVCNTSVTNRKENDEWEGLLKTVDEVVVAPRIYDRKVFRDCFMTGEGVYEMTNNDARSEINKLYEVFYG